MPMPQHLPTIDTNRIAAVCASLGLSTIQISAILGLSPKTVRRYYSEAIAEGAERAAAQRLTKTLDSISKNAGGAQRSARRPTRVGLQEAAARPQGQAANE
jgi:predicted transcriptional regulator